MFINMTPHEVIILSAAGDEIKLPPSGQVVRLAQETRLLGEFGGVLISTKDTTIGELPPPVWVRVKGDCTCDTPYSVHVARTSSACACGMSQFIRKLYVVSLIVAQAAWAIGRLDFLAPDTGPDAIRDDAGQVRAVRRLVAHPDLLVT